MLWPFRGKICHPLVRQWSDSSSSAAPHRWILQARGVKSYKQVWHLSSQKRKSQSCHNRLLLGAEEELIPTSSQGVPGSEPREWISSGSRPVFTDWSMPPVQQLRPALLFGPVFLLRPGSVMVATAPVLYSTPWCFWKGSEHTFTKQCKAYSESA